MEKFIVFAESHWVLSALFIVLLIAVLAYENFMQSGDSAGISPSQAVQMINKEDAVIVDVRRKDAFINGHIINSVNIPHAALKTDIKKLQKHKQKPIVVVCAQGVDAVKAAKIISENEFEHVKVLKGGVRAWREADLPLEKK